MGFKKMLYSLPIAIAGLLPMKEAKGQDIWRRSFPLPTEPINLFISQDDTPQALEYNALTTKEARDAVMPGKVTSDITGKIVGLVCNKTTALFVYDSNNWGKDIYDSDQLIYGGYDGEDHNEILLRGGTRKYFGTLGIPAVGSIDIPATNHQMNYVITGDNIKDGKSYNFIEAAWPWHATDVQPGEVYMPMNEDTVLVYYTYLYKNAEHDKNKANIPVLWLKIENGKWGFVASNPYVNLIMERDKDPPVVTMINNPDPTFIEWNATDNKGIKTIYYTIDDTIPGYTAPKITIPQSGKKQLILSLGRHRIDIIAEDAFRLKGKATQYKDITTAIEPPTTIDSLILYPNPAEDIMHIKYKTNMSQNAYRTIYTLDGKPVERKTIGQMTEEDLDITTLKKGMYIMNIIDGKDRQSIKFIKK